MPVSRGERSKAGWDYTRALTKARARISKANKDGAEPVPEARTRAERAAPALIDFLQAVTLGSTPTELDQVRGGLRIMADLALRQAAMVGLKSVEGVEHDVSDRMRDFLATWMTSSPAREPRANGDDDDANDE